MSAHRSLHRLVLVTALGVSSSLAGAAVSTPPKDGGPGTAPRPGQPDLPSRYQSRGALPANDWLMLVSKVDVTVAQQDAITPLVRNYLRDSKAWTNGGSKRMRLLIEQARETDGEERKAIMDQVRAIRRTMPRYDRVKDAIWEQLTPAQRSELFEEIAEFEAKRRLPSGPPKRGLGAEGDAGARKDGGDGKGTDALDKGKKPGDAKAEKAWRFANDTDPDRHDPRPKGDDDPQPKGDDDLDSKGAEDPASKRS